MPDEHKLSSLGSAKNFQIRAGKSAKSSIGASEGTDASTSKPTFPISSARRLVTVLPSNKELSTSQSRHALVRADTSKDTGTRDLWRAAFESLSYDEQSALDPSTNQDPKKPPSHLVDEVIDLTREKCAQYEAGGWHIKREGHEDINVREKAKSLICSALVVKDLIDAGLQFDVSGYGALAWSVVSFGLQLVQNDRDRLSAIFDSSEFLVQVLARYANIEANYRDRVMNDSETFEKVIVDVYVAVLQYSAKVKSSQRARRARRVLEALTSLTGQPLQRLKEDVASKDNEAEKWRALVEHQYRLKESAEIGKKAEDILLDVSKVVKELEAVQTAVLTAEEDGIIQWLSAVNFSDKHERLRKDVQETNPNSGQWFLESDRFAEWRFYPQSFLWLYGDSGCGKSCLCSTIVENLDELCFQDQSKILAYWYFDFNNFAHQDIEGMLLSLIRRLSAGVDGFSDAVRRLSQIHRRRGSHPSTDELLAAFHSVITSLKKDVFLVLDALDEYPEDARYVKRSLLLSVISAIVEEGHSNLHLLVTSRPENDIRDRLRILSNPPQELNVEDPLSVDLELFFDTTMELSPALKSLGEKIKDKIRKRLITGKQKKFRWAALQLDELQLCRGNEEQVRMSLGTIPDTIEAIYNQVLDNIKKHDCEPAQSIFKWLCVSKRPLSQVELARAAGLANPADVMRICTSSLLTSSIEEIEVNGQKEDREIIRFAHSSVSEYLLSQRLQSSTDKAARFYVSSDEAHAYVSSRCLDYLLEQGGEVHPKPRLLAIPLLDYAAQYWHIHHKSIEVTDFQLVVTNVKRVDLEAIEGKIHDLFRPSCLPAYFNWLRLADPDDSDNPTIPEKDADSYPEPLYYALLLRLSNIAKQLVEDGAELDGRGGNEGTPLQLAAHRGYTPMVQLLLRKGADPNREGRSHGSALYAAALQGYEDIVDALIESNADVNKREGYYGNALQVATYLGYYLIVRHLLWKKADVKATGGVFGTVLQAACAADHGKLISILIDAGADVDCRAGLLKSPLQAALAGEDFDAMHQLIQHVVKFNYNGARAWRAAYSKLLTEHAPLMTEFEGILKLGQDIPPELTSLRQLLAAIVQRSSKPGIRESESDLQAISDNGRKTWGRIVKLIEELDAQNDKPEQGGYLQCRAYWTATRLAAPLVLHARNEESLLLFELVTRIAGRVKHYEAVAFVYKEAECVQLQETAVTLCYSLLMVQIRIVCPNDSDKYGILSRQSTRGFLDALDEYAIIKQVDEICSDLVAYVQGVNFAAALERIKRMEAEMEEKVRAEVARQFEKAAPLLAHNMWRLFHDALMQQNANRRPPPPQNIADGEGSHDDAGSRNPQQRDDQAEGHNDDASTSRDSQPESHKDSPTSQQTEG